MAKIDTLKVGHQYRIQPGGTYGLSYVGKFLGIEKVDARSRRWQEPRTERRARFEIVGRYDHHGIIRTNVDQVGREYLLTWREFTEVEVPHIEAHNAAARARRDEKVKAHDAAVEAAKADAQVLQDLVAELEAAEVAVPLRLRQAVAHTRFGEEDVPKTTDEIAEGLVARDYGMNISIRDLLKILALKEA